MLLLLLQSLTHYHQRDNQCINTWRLQVSLRLVFVSIFVVACCWLCLQFGLHLFFFNTLEAFAKNVFLIPFALSTSVCFFLRFCLVKVLEVFKDVFLKILLSLKMFMLWWWSEGMVLIIICWSAFLPILGMLNIFHPAYDRSLRTGLCWRNICTFGFRRG